MALVQGQSSSHRRSSSSTSQAALLRARRDLCNAKLTFQAELPDTSTVHVRGKGPGGLDRIGFRLEQSSQQQMGLGVSSISDMFLARNTPIVEYNIQQERNRRSLYKISPGDRIRAINSCGASEAMMHVLQRASDEEMKLKLDMERELEDVLQMPSFQGEQEKCPNLPPLCRWSQRRASVTSACSDPVATDLFSEDEFGKPMDRRLSQASTRASSRASSCVSRCRP
eukprot:TRINITY_DN23968_c0_g1_i1.p1 TRINITY_DN23968_c0_g1~~TRINITY_DN23968_c0_g1_i1.p1  ORF type:complete len:226 (+),score=35.91 TRINITY_DN23968_c0_g1_i1:165-842(+)